MTKEVPMRAFIVSTVVIMCLYQSVQANGRFPSSVSVNFRPGNPTAIYLGATFGLLLSHDDGEGFYWICEENIGYAGTYDPRYRVASDGTIYATTFDGLRVSRDGGCSFQTATAGRPNTDPGYIADVWVDGLDVGSDGAVWVTTAEAGRPNDVYRSTDGAASFSPLGLASPVIWWKGVTVAPENAARAYVTGYQVTQTDPDGGTIAPTVHLYRTDDSGQSWTQLSITSFALGTSPLLLLAAVAPGDGSTLFIRSVRAASLGDVLYRSADAGVTWTQVLTTTDTIRDVVVRASGEVLVATVGGGMSRSTDGGVTFESLASAPQAACLGDRGGTLFACGANWEPDFFTLGRSADASSWSQVLRFVEIKGPLSCPTGTVQRDTCEALQWPPLREQFGIPPGGGVDAAGPPRDSSGCCGAGNGSGPLAPALVVIVGVFARRRRYAPR
jgi:MYXO-CTERM domain-containing protein